MFKTLATLCFLLAAFLIAVHKTPSAKATVTDNFNAHMDIHRADFRPAHRNTQLQRNESRKRLLKRSQASQSALLEAAGLQLQSTDLIHWDTQKFKIHLANINDQDAQALIKDLLASQNAGTRLDKPGSLLPNNATPWSSWSGILSSLSYNSKHAVLGGLLAELASRDFDDTLELMDSLAFGPKEKFIEHYLYQSVLHSGYRQYPEKAWNTYLSKCSSYLGFG